MSARHYDVVLLDALGTVLDLEPPAPLLVAELAARGVRVAEADAHRAMVAEMTYYRAHCDRAHDRPSLEALRARCAEIVAGELGAPAAGLPLAAVRDALLASLRFPPFPEVAEVLSALRAAGVRLVVVSNWDVSLHDALAASGLDALLDGALTSAETGTAKPDPGLLRRGLALAGGVPAARALMVGDTRPDVEAARAAGCDAVLVARHGSPAGEPWTTAEPPPRIVADLRALPELVGVYPVRDA